MKGEIHSSLLSNPPSESCIFFYYRVNLYRCDRHKLLRVFQGVIFFTEFLVATGLCYNNSGVYVEIKVSNDTRDADIFNNVYLKNLYTPMFMSVK